MNSSERHIEAMDTLAQQKRQRQSIHDPPGSSGGGPSAFGQGIGNLGGWVMFLACSELCWAACWAAV